MSENDFKKCRVLQSLFYGESSSNCDTSNISFYTTKKL